MAERTGETAGLAGRRRRAMGGACRLFYDRPLTLVRGQGVWLYDDGGRAYLDAYNNVPIVGHCHPRVVEAVSRQLATLNTHTRYLNEGVIECAERLLGRFPAELNRVMFACSGTEAVELALRVARAHTGAAGIIVTSHAYHGNSAAVAQISPGEPAPEGRGPHVATIAAPAMRRGHKGPGEEAADHHLSLLEAAIRELGGRGVRPAALVLDTVFSSEGIVRCPPGYLPGAAAIVRAAGGVFIADEVQAGFGRCGTHFWGFETHGVTPDIVTLGKPMGNGYPVAAMVTRAGILDSFAGSASYFNTFGGSQAACAAAMAVLEVIEEEGLQANALEVGEYLRSGLEQLAEKYPFIGDVRGRGLYLGLELVPDDPNQAPSPRAAHGLANRLRERGVLVGVTGPAANVLKLRPPLVFSRANAGLLLQQLEEALKTPGIRNP